MGHHSIASLNSFNTKQTLLAKQNLGDVFEKAKVKKMARANYIYLPDAQADKIYLVKQGRVRVGIYGSGGREITKNIFQAGDVFGESALTGETLRRNFACTLEPTTLAVMSVADFKTQLRHHPALTQKLLELIGRRLIETEQRLESLVFKNSRDRIIEYLHQLGERQGQRVGYEMLVRKFLTHQEIANITATSRQTVTTILNELRNANVITFNRKRLLIRDMDTLAQWAA